jgi:hypothetical protein
MRELRLWIITFLVVEAAWVTYLMRALFATAVIVEEQSIILDFDQFYLMPSMAIMLSSIGLWLIAAFARTIALLFQSIIKLKATVYQLRATQLNS